MSNNTWQEKEEGPAHPVMLLLKPKKDAAGIRKKHKM